MDAAKAACDAAENLEKKFFDTHGVEHAKDKAKMVAEAITAAVALVDPLIGAGSSDPTFLFMKGKTLNIPQSYSKEAETLLSKCVKLDPAMVDGWNELGTCVWKKGDLAQAKTCFKTAIKVRENKDSLQHLSMLLRSLPGSDLEKANNINESLDLAKQATKFEVADGHSWFVLGNAYLALFFSQMESADHIKKAMVAYRQAETDKAEATNNPDLHHNSATVHEYQEDYDRAVEGFQLSAVLDPDWPTPKAAVEKIRTRCVEICDSIENKGKMKQKRLAGIVGVLNELGKQVDSAATVPVSDLKEGVNDLKATRITITKVFPVGQPQTYLGVDGDGTWVAVTVYNMVPDAIAMEDTIIIPEPFYRNVTVNKMPMDGSSGKFEYPSIRVDNPVTLFVNGPALGEDKLAKSTLGIQSQTIEGAGADE